MKTILPVLRAYTNAELDAILDDPAPTVVTDLEQLDLLIWRAYQRNLEVEFKRPAGYAAVDLAKALELRNECGFDLRSPAEQLI